MKTLALLIALTGCSLTQKTVTKKCPTTPAIVGDAVAAAVPLAISVDAWTRNDGATMALSLGAFAAIIMTATYANDTCK